MKRFLLILLILIISLLLFACNSNTSIVEPGISGYVVKIEGRRFLVVSSEPEDFSRTSGGEEFYNAVWFSNASKEIQIGQTVLVWFDLMNASYPGQSKAKMVSIRPSNKPNNANLSEAEAIREALIIHGGAEVPVIKTANYDTNSDVWTIRIKQGEHETNVQVKDK